MTGSIEILFSLPSKAAIVKDEENFPIFKSLLQKHGINDATVLHQEKMPDPKKAKELLEKYTAPLVIRIEKSGSRLFENFGHYLPILASVSTNI